MMAGNQFSLAFHAESAGPPPPTGPNVRKDMNPYHQPPTDEQLEKWRKQFIHAGNGHERGVYAANRFEVLLDEVIRLRKEIELWEDSSRVMRNQISIAFSGDTVYCPRCRKPLDYDGYCD